MVCLQSSLDEMKEIASKMNEDEYHFFEDADYPPEIGWTAIAFKPMTKEQGDKIFGHLRLA